MNSPAWCTVMQIVADDAWVDDLEGATQDDVDAERGGPLVEEDLAGGDWPSHAVPGDAPELSVGQLREHLLPALW